MTQMFGGAPKAPKMPASVAPNNPQLDAVAKADAQRRGAAASVIANQTGTAPAPAKGSVFGQ